MFDLFSPEDLYSIQPKKENPFFLVSNGMMNEKIRYGTDKSGINTMIVRYDSESDLLNFLSKKMDEKKAARLIEESKEKINQWIIYESYDGYIF